MLLELQLGAILRVVRQVGGRLLVRQRGADAEARVVLELAVQLRVLAAVEGASIGLVLHLLLFEICREAFLLLGVVLRLLFGSADGQLLVLGVELAVRFHDVAVLHLVECQLLEVLRVQFIIL